MEAVMAQTQQTMDRSDQRQFPRVGLPVGYAAVRVREPGRRFFNREGHIYDLSEGGMRFDLDEPLDLDQPVEVELDLPGGGGMIAIRATGNAVRFHDHPDDSPGVVRMGMRFEHVDQPARLSRYLLNASLAASAA